MSTLKPLDLLDVSLSRLSRSDFLDCIRASLPTQSRLLIGYANIYGLNLARERLAFRQALHSFDIVFCDGFGVMLGARLSGQSIPERYTPPDFIDELMQSIRGQQCSVYLLGAAPGVAGRAAQTLTSRTPDLRIAGYMHGLFDKTPGSVENKAVIEQINAVRPALLLVAFGMPQQEEWLAQNWASLDVQVALCVGALFDTLAGDIWRAPRWVTDHGLEWLARLLVEPGRLWRRYLIGNPLFFWRILQNNWFKKHSEGKIH